MTNTGPIDELYRKAEELAGRPVEVIGTKDGEYIVEYLNFNTSPPPKATSEENALQDFIAWLQARKIADIVDNIDVGEVSTTKP